MRSSHILIAALTILLSALVAAQDGCASPCFSNTTMTDCGSGEWPCLCKNTTYVNSVNSCVMNVCNSTDSRLGAYYAFSQICAIFGVNLTQPQEISALSAASTSSLLNARSTDDIYSILPITTTTNPLGGPSAIRPTTAPGLPTASLTVRPPGNYSSGTGSAASTLSTLNPGGPVASSNLSTTAVPTSTSTMVITDGSTGTGGASASATSAGGDSSNGAMGRSEGMVGVYGAAMIGFAAWAFTYL